MRRLPGFTALYTFFRVNRPRHRVLARLTALACLALTLCVAPAAVTCVADDHASGAELLWDGCCAPSPAAGDHAPEGIVQAAPDCSSCSDSFLLAGAHTAPAPTLQHAWACTPHVAVPALEGPALPARERAVPLARTQSDDSLSSTVLLI